LSIVYKIMHYKNVLPCKKTQSPPSVFDIPPVLCVLCLRKSKPYGNKNMIKNIVFDIGMVLADFRWEAYMRDDLHFNEEVIKTIGEKVVLTNLWDELDLGVRETEDVINEMKAQVPEYQKEINIFFDGIVDIIASYPYSRQWILDLKAAGYKVYLLSNYPRDIFSLHARTRFTFVDVVDGMVVSGFEKVSKPDPAIYKLLFDRYDLRPEECLFTDDRPVNIEAARKLGMTAVLFTGYDTVRPQIDKILADVAKA